MALGSSNTARFKACCACSSLSGAQVGVAEAIVQFSAERIDFAFGLQHLDRCRNVAGGQRRLSEELVRQGQCRIDLQSLIRLDSRLLAQFPPQEPPPANR